MPPNAGLFLMPSPSESSPGRARDRAASIPRARIYRNTAAGRQRRSGARARDGPPRDGPPRDGPGMARPRGASASGRVRGYPLSPPTPPYVRVAAFAIDLPCPLLTSGRTSRRLATPAVGFDPGIRPDLPGYCAPAFTLMPGGFTGQRSVQVSGFDEFGRLAPLTRLIRFLFVRPALCHPASFRPRSPGLPLPSANASPCRASRGLPPPSGCALPGAPKKTAPRRAPWRSIASRLIRPVPTGARLRRRLAAARCRRWP